MGSMGGMFRGCARSVEMPATRVGPWWAKFRGVARTGYKLGCLWHRGVTIM